MDSAPMRERGKGEITGEGCNGGTNLPCFSLLLLLHFFYCRGILSRMDPSERKREGRGNHWRINLHSRAITIGVVRSVIDHSRNGAEDLCLLVSCPLLSESHSAPLRGAKKEGIVPNIAPRPRANRRGIQPRRVAKGVPRK